MKPITLNGKTYRLLHRIAPKERPALLAVSGRTPLKPEDLEQHWAGKWRVVEQPPVYIAYDPRYVSFNALPVVMERKALPHHNEDWPRISSPPGWVIPAPNGDKEIAREMANHVLRLFLPDVPPDKVAFTYTYGGENAYWFERDDLARHIRWIRQDEEM